MSQIKIKAETAPSTPETGYVSVYAKTDKKLYIKDDAGTETDLTATGGGGGSVATDTIFDAKGDLPVGTGADTAARLPVGTNGQVLTADSTQTTGVKWASVSGTGDVVGPASSTDNAVARFDGTTGKLLQDTSTFTISDLGEATSNTLTASRLLVSGASKQIQSSSVTTTEAGYLSGVTSAIQTQLDNKQPLDAELTALAGLTSAADKLPYFTGSGTASLADLTAAGRALIDDASASAQRTTLGLGTVATLASDVDGTLAANSDTNIPTQKAVKTYVDNSVTGLWDLKGSTDCSANPNYPAALKGDAYVVSVAGKIGGASGTPVDVGDVYVALADNAGGTQAGVGTSWFILEHNLQGALLASNNLSDVTNAATARSNLGVAIGTDVQAFDAELSALAGLTSAADKLPYFTGSGTAATTDLTATARTLLDDTSTSAMRTTLGVAIGTDVQAFDQDLSDIAGLTTSQGDILYKSATQWTRLPAGTSGQFLQTQGAGANPQWATASGSGAVGSDSIWDAKGDLAVGTGADTASRLPVGTNGQVLTADSAETTGLKWTTVSGTGDVVGPASAVDNRISRFDGTTGKLIQSSAVTLDDTGNLSGVGTLNTHTIPGGTGTIALTSDITGTNSGTNTGDQTITLTGDVTGSGTGSFAATISNDAVTYAKIQNVSATDKILGRVTSGAGDIEEITCTAAGRALLDDADASAQRTTLGLGTLATQSGTFSGTSSGTNTGDQTITLTGDVTGSGTGSFAATIANDAVTYAKIQNVSAADKLLGRVTTGAGDIEEITCTAAGRAILDDADAAAQRATLGVGTIGTLATIATAITCVFDGMGSAIASGSRVYLEIPYAMTITGWTLVADQTGSIVIDVWKDTYTNYPPTVGDTITGTEKPTLSSASKNQDLSLSSWTTSVSSGDTLVFNVDSASTVTKATLVIRGTRTA